MEHFYHLTEGEDWFNYSDLYTEMVRLALPEARFVEVGVWKGRSAAFLAVEIINSGKRISLDLVDTWQGSPEHQPLTYDLYSIFEKNIEPVKNQVNIKRVDSVTASMDYEDESIDFVFIDAAHDYHSVKEDIKSWLPKIKQGGYLSGHDYVTWPGVKIAVDEVFGPSNITIKGDTWLFKIPYKNIDNHGNQF